MAYRSRWREARSGSREFDHSLDFGLSISWAREAKGLNDLDLAGLVGVGRTTITNWQNGQLPPRKLAERVFPLLAQHLGLDKEVLWWNWQAGWAGRNHRQHLQWAADIRRFPRGHRKDRLAELWGITPQAARGRIERMLKLGYLSLDDTRQWDVCQKGLHLLTSENRSKSSSRGCRRCANEYSYAWRKRKIRKGLSLEEIERIDHKGRRCAGVPIKAFEETKTIMEWSKDPRCVVAYRTFNARLNYGWDPVRALTTPSSRKSK